MTHNFKVGQKVRVITGANVVNSDMFNYMEGVIIDIARNNTPDVCIYVDFQNGYKIWCYTQKDRGIELNVEILQDDTDKPVMWRKIDPNDIPTDVVLCANKDKSKIVINRIGVNALDGKIQSNNRREFFEVNYYIPLSDLINLPIQP